MIKITTTKNFSAKEVKVLVFSPAGFGKTRLCATAPNPIIVSAEGGLLSLANEDVPVIEVKTLADIGEAYNFLTISKESKKYDTVCIDSISEIAEVMIITYKKQEKDPRAAYGRYNDDFASMIRMFRDLKGKHCYFTAKMLRNVEDNNSMAQNIPSLPGKTMLNALPYFFDEVFALRIGKMKDRTSYRYLQTVADYQYECKDRSGNLLPKEKPDLTYVFNKISGKKGGDTKPKEEVTTETIKLNKEDENGKTTTSG